MNQTNISLRLFDFHVLNESPTVDSDSSESGRKKDINEFVIQAFGKDETGTSYSLFLEKFKPFFYVKVGNNWDIPKKEAFLRSLQKRMGNYYQDSLCVKECRLIQRKKLYGFDNGKQHLFVLLKFKNMQAFNKTKQMWFQTDSDSSSHLLPGGLVFQGTATYLYEANIPPLLRFFHMQNVSPSGWITFPKKKTRISHVKRTHCDVEYCLSYSDVTPIDCDTQVPLTICSFDIEASSSHGDFPLPVKTYKKLATHIVDALMEKNNKIDTTTMDAFLRNVILAAFGYTHSTYPTYSEPERVYPKVQPTREEVEALVTRWLATPLPQDRRPRLDDTLTIEAFFERMAKDQEDDEEDGDMKYKATVPSQSIPQLLLEKRDRNETIIRLTLSLNAVFPKVEGDKVTFIGSTFLRLGEKEPYLNHCVVLDSCASVENATIESYSTEAELLLGWREVMERENPDIVIGYNIFGFDYEFMFRRAVETGCVKDFLRLSKNCDEICGKRNPQTNQYELEQTSIHIASGQHDLTYIKMPGRVQIDMYNYFRREENLPSYKLDFVAGHFLGDYVKQVETETETESCSWITTTNMTGLYPETYIHFEEIGHSTEYYEGGAKFRVVSIDPENKRFLVDKNIYMSTTKKMRWCLAKDDVSPKDIFEMTRGSDNDRAVIAKYCIQDCQLVHQLMRKVDTWTGFTEMATICSVPIHFLVLRGQGIKLTSYVAKKCREKGVLMPVMEKSEDNDGYEGAIVLDPKCDLYLDNPVACVDYASLYPSSMMSENISHDSKVWTKEYNLQNVCTEETGEKDPKTGSFLYDNLPGIQYVDIQYDTYQYIRKTEKAAAEKVRVGYKICRFAQPTEGSSRAIMPSILEELLMARKTTRKQIPLQTDDFMKNVLDKRQLGYKITANSLYGQCGAKTSSFYEKDCAASTTATGRLLLLYAKRVVEECYGNRLCDTSQGPVVTKAEYIYGDTDSVFFTFNLETSDGEKIRGQKALEITIELAQQVGHLASQFLKQPHDLEYEKTFMPFCLLSKKRYVGMLYETDASLNKAKRKEMGIVLKRRDNAPIVKDIYGGIIDILMKEQNLEKALIFLRQSLQDIVDEKNPIEKCIISKSLRSGYKNPKSIAHKVLSDRMTARDPGNKPSSGDRIPYVYIVNPDKKALQGDKIETPSYVLEKRLQIDYPFYITNQIMKPVQQLFSLVLEKIWIMQNKRAKLEKFKKEVGSILKDKEKAVDKIETLKNKEIKILLFDEFLQEKTHGKNITSFFQKK